MFGLSSGDFIAGIGLSTQSFDRTLISIHNGQARSWTPRIFIFFAHNLHVLFVYLRIVNHQDVRNPVAKSKSVSSKPYTLIVETSSTKSPCFLQSFPQYGHLHRSEQRCFQDVLCNVSPPQRTVKYSRLSESYHPPTSAAQTAKFKDLLSPIQPPLVTLSIEPETWIQPVENALHSWSHRRSIPRMF